MSRSTLGDLRQRMTAVWQEAAISGYRLEDVIPEEMQDHFQNLTELRYAKEYIKDVEERETKLREEKDGLCKALEVEKKKVNELPDDHKQLQHDYKMVEKKAEFYKALMDRAEERANDYHARWQSAQKTQINSEATEMKITALDLENEQLRVNLMKKVQENQAVRDLFHELQARKEAALEEKNTQLTAKQIYITKMEAFYEEQEKENDTLEEKYNGLVQDMENENEDCAAALNLKTERLRIAEKHKMAAVSEVKILAKYYQRALQILHIYRSTFQQLLSLDDNKIMWLPDDLQVTLASAQRECEDFDIMHEVMQMEGLNEDEVRGELTVLALSAKKMQECLQVIAGDVSSFLQTLRQKPDLRSIIKLKFGSLMVK